MGAGAYKLIDKYIGMLRGAVVEIGSESPIFHEGSTCYLALLCGKHDLPFYSIDFDREAYEIAASVNGVKAYNMKGEEFLENVFPGFNQKICFAYLDNYDWTYSWNVKKNPPWKKVMENKYESCGLEVNNLNSQTAHLAQSILVDRYSADKCAVIFDDTWQTPDMTFSGKGGSAVPYLLCRGFRLLEKPMIGNERADGFVILGRNIEGK